MQSIRLSPFFINLYIWKIIHAWKKATHAHSYFPADQQNGKLLVFSQGEMIINPVVVVEGYREDQGL